MIGCKKEQKENTTMKVGETNSTDFYQDFDPNIIFPSNATGYKYELDINGDSINDIEFKYVADVGNFYGYHGTYLAHINSNFYYLLDSSGIKVCNENDLVSCNDIYDNLGGDYEPFTLSYDYYSSGPVQINDTTWEFNDTSYYSGNWHNVENKFIVYKFLDENGWYIGWIRLGFNDDGKLEIYEYGYKKVNGCS
jgi:hypothetical protein